MNKIYKTQDYLRISLFYEEDLTNVASAKIKYIDPEGTAGEWTAVHDAVNNKVYYDVPLGEPLEIAGKWTVWSYLTITGGKVLPGTPSYFTVYDEGGETTSNCISGNCY